MKRKNRYLNNIFTSILFVAVFACVTSTWSHAADDTEAYSARNVKLRKSIGDSLAKGRPVFAYFYSDLVEDSRDELALVKKVASEGGADVVEIDAMEAGGMRSGYEIDYAPTVILLRPDRGMAGIWVVDFTKKQLANALKNGSKPTAYQESIADGIKGKKPQLLFFMADWCGYCRYTTPEVARFEKEHSDAVNVVTINIDRDNILKELHYVDGVPALLLLDENGVVLERTGYPAGYKEFKTFFKGIGVELDDKKKPAPKAKSPAPKKTVEM